MGDLIKFGFKWFIAVPALLAGLILTALSIGEGAYDTVSKDGRDGEGLSEQFIRRSIDAGAGNTNAIAKSLGENVGVYDPNKGLSIPERVEDLVKEFGASSIDGEKNMEICVKETKDFLGCAKQTNNNQTNNNQSYDR